MAKKYWFTAKKYGWGWKPTSMEGWIVTVLYTLSIFYFFFQFDARSHSVSDTLISFLPVAIILTGLLIAICYRYGEKPRWQWGEKPRKKPSKRKKDK